MFLHSTFIFLFFLSLLKILMFLWIDQFDDYIIFYFSRNNSQFLRLYIWCEKTSNCILLYRFNLFERVYQSRKNEELRHFDCIKMFTKYWKCKHNCHRIWCDWKYYHARWTRRFYESLSLYLLSLIQSLTTF